MCRLKVIISDYCLIKALKTEEISYFCGRKNKLMKYLALSILVALTVVSCSEDFNLIAPKQEIPIVYGFLSMTDTAQYIRVQRAFRDESISAVELAQIPDSLYYDNATVTITDLTADTMYTLTRVNGNDEGFQKEEGAFATDPNFLYKIRTEEIDLVEGNQYQLTINTGEEGMVEATSVITMGEIPRLTTPRSDFDFAFNFDSESTVSWRRVEDIVLYDVNFFINYKERDITDIEGDFVDKQIEWSVGRNIEDERLFIPGIDFFTFMLESLDEEETILRRFLDIECELVGGGQELFDFINVAQANTGITSSGETPIFTNIENGFGFFSSRNSVRVPNVLLTNRTLDSLQNSQLTAELNFQQ